MEQNGPSIAAPTQPDLTDAETLRFLAFHRDELVTLNRRHLLSDDALATALRELDERRDRVETRLRTQDALDRARTQRLYHPLHALETAESARSLDPDRLETWELVHEILTQLGARDRDQQLRAEWATRFPGRPWLDQAVAQAQADASVLPGSVEEALRQVRQALQNGDDDQAIRLCKAYLAEHPEATDLLVHLAFAHRRRGDIAEALTLYERLTTLQPEVAVWKQWLDHLRARLPEVHGTPLVSSAPAMESDSSRAAPPVSSPELPELPQSMPTGVSWSEIAGELLQDHWQKLILCLAVLLIVVSSNVGAYQLLGPVIWSPVGKSILAIVYTSMIAAFGAGLVRWGAERAGRIMLLTTLVLVPANFMLAGEMKLAGSPSPFELAILGVDSLLLFLLVRAVGWALGVSRSAWILSSWLFGLCVFNAAVAPGSPWPWSWQFATFLAPGIVYLGSVSWLNRRYVPDEHLDPLETTYAGLGLLSFAYLTGIIRTGGFILHLPPYLYAMPTMFGAVAGVVTATNLARFDKSSRRATWLRFAGLTLAGLGLALALAQPPVRSALASGNTLAAALVALALFTSLLVRERHPAFLYVAFGTLVIVYFGAFYFVRDLVHAMEEVARQALGYSRPLPQAFKAINGLVFNVVLAVLALVFRRVWDDRRLARHCHYLGLPVSIACCLLSMIEPKAAAICLPGYAILYAIGVAVFRQPRLIYLAAAALAGGISFLASLRAGTTLADEALLTALIGLVSWGLRGVLTRFEVDPEYRRALGRSGVGVGLLATLMAVVSVVPPGPVALTAVLACLVASTTALLLNRTTPQLALGYMAAITGSLGYAFLVLHLGARNGGVTIAQFSLASAAAGLGLSLLRLGLRWTRSDDSPSSALGVLARPLEHVAFAQVSLAVACASFLVLAGIGHLAMRDHATVALGLALAALDLMILTRFYPNPSLANVTLTVGLGAWLAAVRPVTGHLIDELAEMGLVGVSYALAILIVERASAWLTGLRNARLDSEREPWHGGRAERFAEVLPDFTLSLVAASVALLALDWTANAVTVATLALGSIAILTTTLLRRVTWRVDLAVALGLASTWAATAWRVAPGSPVSLLSWLALTTSGVSLMVRGVGEICERAERETLRFYALPCLRDTSALAWLVVPLALVGWARAYPTSYQQSALATGIASVVVLSLTWVRPPRRFTYRAIASAVLATYLVILSQPAQPGMMHVPGLIAVGLSLFLQALGFSLRAANRPTWEWLYVRPLFHSAVVMATLGVLTAWWSPLAMGLAACSSLVMVKSLASRAWLYPAVGTAALAIHFGYLVHQPPERMVTAAIVIAYQLWILGWLVQRANPRLVRLLRLRDQEYAFPLFHCAIVAASAAAMLRLGETMQGEVPFHGSWGLLLNLALFSILMTRPYPNSGWIHLGTLLASASAAAGIEPRITTGSWWLAVLIGLGNGWLAVSRLATRLEVGLSRWIGPASARLGFVFRFWAWIDLGLGTLLTSVMVLLGTVAAIEGQPVADLTHPAHWWPVMASLGLSIVFLGRVTKRTDWADPAMTLIVLFLLGLWWVGAPGSPVLERLGWNARAYLPIVTAIVSLLAAVASCLVLDPILRSDAGTDTLPDGLAAQLRQLNRFGWSLATTLAPLAVLSGLVGSRLTLATTLGLTSLALGLTALARRRPGQAYLASVFLSVAGGLASLEAASRLGLAAGSDRSIVVALGLLGVVGLLWLASGWIRLRDPAALLVGDASDLPARNVPLAIEQVCLLTALFCAGGVATTVFGLGRPTDRAAIAGVGILLGLTLTAIGLLLRWGANWLVTLAHAAILGAFLYYRWAFPMPAVADAGILTVLGYLDFGLAEVMHRVGLGRYAGPTRRFALVLPLLPLAIAWLGGPIQELTLFLLLAAASFYGVACVRLQSKPIAYASAVLFNAFLWFLWWRVGFAFSDRPQFFLIPVGLSAILFAEANRGALRREGLNAVRGVGLMLIYASLAVPIWDQQSLGAWLVLLLLSLAGIFVGIGLRVQTFLWLGLAMFVLDVVYQLGRVGSENTLAKWAIMFSLGIALVLFVALNEKKQILKTLRDYYDTARQWE
ncbi:MAG: hypothetical protein U0794_02825 [Isosphaeraceae bacterium]